MTSAVRLAPGIGHNIEAGQQRFSVGAHRQNAAALPAACRQLRIVFGLGKVQAQFVDALLQRNVVAEAALAAGAVKIRILGATNALHGAFDRRTPVKPGVRIPQFAGMIHKAAP